MMNRLLLSVCVSALVFVSACGDDDVGATNSGNGGSSAEVTNSSNASSGVGGTTATGGAAPGDWTCVETAYGDGICDCGCAVADPDCSPGCAQASCYDDTCGRCHDDNGEVDCLSLTDGPLDVVVEVPPSGPYGTRTFSVPAATNWVNSGLFLRAGQSATVSATGTWMVDTATVGPEGDAGLGDERGCPVGALVARSGLHYQDALTCIGSQGTFVATKDDTVYLAMISSTDLGETYGERLILSGQLSVTVTSDGDTVPSVRATSFAGYDLSSVASGSIEIVGKHIIVSVDTAQAQIDSATAVESLRLLDRTYEIEAELRGNTPFSGQRVRFAPDDLGGFYMLAGNPIRVTRDILEGPDNIRILRASEATTDIWGFAHELGHVFSFANGTWVFQYVNVESWPNIFTIDALTQLGRTANQPNLNTYCDGKDAYLANGTYATLRDDPFVQLCFLMQFTDQYGWDFWKTFYSGIDNTTNADVGYDGTDASVWRFNRDRFSQAAGEDVTPRFQQWRAPLQ